MKKIKPVNSSLPVNPDNAAHHINNVNGDVRPFLHVSWDDDAKDRVKAVAIGINPSTAKNGKSDNTVTRLCRFLDMYGINELEMLNLYESSSPVQKNMVKNEETETDFETKRWHFDTADIILVVWGVNEKTYQNQIEKAKQVLRDYKDKVYCIQRPVKGIYRKPCHPSRLSYNTAEIVKYDSVN